MSLLDTLPLREARNLYIANAPRLLAERWWAPAKRPMDEVSVFLWAAQVTHEVSPRLGSGLAKGNGGIMALALCTEQRVRYSAAYLEQKARDPDCLLDTVLHELGHLFTWWFFGTAGHDADWQKLGMLVGYVPVGTTTDARRKRYQQGMLLQRMRAHSMLGEP
jgi:hypothetical protein